MMSVGFCVTGGEDQVLRVWPMDFSEYILEAEHEGIITSLALSEDGMHVACGTSSGGLGVLDLTNHNYKTVLRSHTDVVLQIVYHEYSGSIITLSADQTIRLWDPEKLEQTYEFLYPKEDPCTCISSNPLSMFFAAGFKSGMLRIFDIEKTCISEELKQHEDAIEYIEYSTDGKFLAVLEKKLAMLYSPLHAYQAIKHLPIELPSKFVSCSFSPDSGTLAIIGDSGTHINIWELKTLQMIGKLFTSKIIKKLKFSPEGGLWATFEDAGVRRYNINQMTI
jgi:WD40 repeat protein